MRRVVPDVIFVILFFHGNQDTKTKPQIAEGRSVTRSIHGLRICGKKNRNFYSLFCSEAAPVLRLRAVLSLVLPNWQVKLMENRLLSHSFCQVVFTLLY